MAGVTTALALGASAVGGAMQSRAQKKAAQAAAAAAEFTPYDVTGAGGSVRFGPDNQLSISGDQNSQMFQQLFSQQAQNLLGGQGYGADAINMANVLGTQALPGAFQGAMSAANPLSALTAGNQFTQFAGQNALMGQQAGMGQINAAQQLFGGGPSGFGQQDNFRDIAASQLDRQRQLARPGEERLVNSKFQNLFNRGTLSATSGERQLGDLQQGLEQADIARSLGADQFANTLSQQQRAFGLQQAGLNNQFTLGAGGSLLAGGQGLLNFGQNAGASAYNTQLGMNNLVNTRGQQRLQNASSLLGFGQGLQNTNLQQALALFGGTSQINADQRALAALGANIGSADAQAGAQQGQFLQGTGQSPMGSFLGGLGSGALGAGVSGGPSIGSLFGFGGGGGGGTPKAAYNGPVPTRGYV